MPEAVPAFRLEAVAITATLVLVGLGAGGLALAVAGAFEPVLVWPLGLAAAAGLIALWRPWTAWRRATLGRGPAPSSLPTLALIAVVIAFGVLTLANRSASFGADRDPGVYATSGVWLAEEGGLVVTGRGDVFAGLDALAVAGNGYPAADADATRLEILYLHLTTTWLAEGHLVAGLGGLRSVPGFIATLGLAAVGLVARRLVSPWLAVAVTAALGLNLALWYVARTTFSEGPMLLAVFSGIVVLLAALTSADAPAGIDPPFPKPRWGWVGPVDARRLVLAGALFGTVALARVDVALSLVGVPVILAVVLRRRSAVRSQRVRAAAAVVAGAVPMVVLAQLDGRLRASVYLEAHATERRLQALAFALSVLIGVVVLVSDGSAVRRARTVVQRRARPLTATLVIGVAVVAIGLAVVRPTLTTVEDPDRPTTLIETVQRREGGPVAPTRSYAELSVRNLSWYVGPPALVLATAGVAVIAARLVRDRTRRAELVVAALVVPVALVYLWRPSILADHPWASRRFVPVVIPGLVLLAGVAVDRFRSASRIAVERWFGAARGRWWGLAVGGLLAVSLVAGPLPRSVGLWAYERDGASVPGVRAFCDRIGPEDAVVFTATDSVGVVFSPMVRAVCGVPAARVDVEAPADDVARALGRVAARVRAEGGRLWLATATPGRVEALLGRPLAPVDTYALRAGERIVETVSEPPGETTSARWEVTLFVLDADSTG